MLQRRVPGLKTPLPKIPGADIAGEVAAIGSAVAPGRWNIGDRVIGVPNQSTGMMGGTKRGGASELVAVPQECVLPIPGKGSFIVSAWLPFASRYGTPLV